MTQVTYKNRYGIIYTFTKQEDGNILWEGDFEWSRFGFPNVYDDAYKAYCKDHENPISLKEFREVVHESIYDTDDNYLGMSEIGKKYATLVYTDRSIIDMVDPSGGPYIHSNMDMGVFDVQFNDMIVERFEPIRSDNKLQAYKIIIKK
jgi:hypothetical protein